MDLNIFQVLKLSKEDEANVLLSIEYLLDTLIYELCMWICLKDDEYNEAWDYLVSAQYAVKFALQVYDFGIEFDDYIERLYMLEYLLFPRQIFVSPGMIIKNSQCSICEQEYGECDHIKGRAYMGKMCYRIIKDVNFKEISIVNDPADKRRRVLSFTDGEVTRDFLTWRPLSDDTLKKSSEGKTSARCILFTAGDNQEHSDSK